MAGMFARNRLTRKPGLDRVGSRAMIDTTLRDEAISLTRDLIRVDTSNPPGNETPAAMVLKRYLEANGIECEIVARDPDRANLIARIPGNGSGPSMALLGHTDVVPADAQDWRRPPFSGDVDDDGYLWGRGAVDMKNETATRAVAMAVLAREGFQPNGDLLYIAEADEEDGTHPVGMIWLVQERPDLATDFAINEGGGDRQVLVDGRVVVPICVGEKCCLAAMVTALGEAGHASTPTAGANAVPLLATLINRLAAHRPKRRLLPETRAMLEALVGDLGDDLDAAIDRACALHPSFADLLPPLFSVTIAPTRLYGSAARNVMPGRASVECDCRILPGDTPELLEAELRDALGTDIPFEIEFPEPPVGGSVATVDTPLYRVCQEFLDQRDPGAVLLPTISTGFTDSHFLRSAFGTAAYGFWPVRHTPPEVIYAGVHNRDERIHVDDLGYALEFTLHACRAVGAMTR
jgi:acetylornithine deacetylase/succinyl-diaminopimelate desuccinylase-like protein